MNNKGTGLMNDGTRFWTKFHHLRGDIQTGRGGLETQIRLKPSVCSFFLFFLTVLIFLNNYRYYNNTRGWQGWYGHQYQHHATLQPQAHHHLRCFGPHFHHQHINISMRLSSYDGSFQPGLKTGCWSSCGLYLCLAWISTTSYFSLVSQRNWWSWWLVIGKGYANPWGTGQGYAWVRVGVSFFRPLANPYPGRGFAGWQGFWLGVLSLCEGNFKLSVNLS